MPDTPIDALILAEHNEVVKLGGSATACPSGRIPWDEILRRLSGPVEPARTVAGVGAHYADGSSEELWNDSTGETLDGIGVRYSNGEIETVWPRVQP